MDESAVFTHVQTVYLKGLSLKNDFTFESTLFRYRSIPRLFECFWDNSSEVGLLVLSGVL